MFKRIVLFLLIIVFISSCNDVRLKEVADPTVRIDIPGASILPPQERAWKIVQKNENQLSLLKGNPQSDTTYAASVMINELPDIESEEQFSEISKKLLSEYDTDRFTIKKEEGEISYSRETYCWRYHMISEDRAAKTRTGQKVMLLEMIGYICQHPKDRKKGINFSYSHRYYPGDEDPKIKNKAKEFLDNVTFTDFISASTTSKAESKAKPYYNRGLTYFRKNQYDDAIIELTKAIELNPKYAMAYYNRGLAYHDNGQYDKAICDYTDAIELNPKHLHAYNNRGYTYLTISQYDQAISDFNKAIEIDGRIAKIYSNRGLAYLKKGQYDQVISDYNRVIELDSRDPYAYHYRGIAHYGKGQYDQAISDFSKTIEIDPRIYEAYIDRGYAYKTKGQYDQAISDYNKAIEIDRKNPRAYNNKAWILATCRDARYRDGAKAVELSEKAVELDTTANTLDTLAAAYAEVGKFDDAIKTQEKAIGLMKKEGKPKSLIEQGIEQLKFYKAHKPLRK